MFQDQDTTRTDDGDRRVLGVRRGTQRRGADRRGLEQRTLIRRLEVAPVDKNRRAVGDIRQQGRRQGAERRREDRRRIGERRIRDRRSEQLN